MKWHTNIYIVLMIACVSDQPMVAKEVVRAVIPSVGIMADDSKLKLVNGLWYYADTLFSGHVHAFHANGNMQRMQGYYSGKEEGLLMTWFPDGQKESERYFVNGEKEGVHKGWWENGQQRFEYHFSNGQYEGDFREWSVNGTMAKHIEYKDGKEQRGKAWRENGKVYMSFEVRGSRRYGMMNAKPCYTLRNEKGEYIEVAVNKSPL
jgi:antitoxin component YwqK of YwqJK toxin-antitoxin module